MAYVPPHKRRSKEGEGCNESNKPPLNSNKRTPCKENYGSLAYNRTTQLPPDFGQITLYYCINLSERPDKWRAFQNRALNVHSEFAGLVKRFDAVNGKHVLREGRCSDDCIKLVWDASINAKYSSRARPGTKTMTAGEVGCALSHVELWKILTSTESSSENPVMMVLEDDAVFSSVAGRSRFVDVLAQALDNVPSDWGILYLGFSGRGERHYVEAMHNKNRHKSKYLYTVEIYQPEYGYHTHAYLITQQAALILLNKLPVQGPIDVWLADNNWFDIPVYSAVIANEGWKREDGTFEGAVLVSQERGHGLKSDVQQSSRVRAGNIAKQNKF
ncbi:hypothetical protein FisN_4Lh034 [Fistulifera solaris]|uniref:Glycosyl transferase family 25 domain-containing protein n=1 Tax=Fistulifera solaris TaxID=1519565 RepID=A0A1Z5KDD3_FISSO|nr:hypothetical protein FisN_4Lh034 [Fistulifera solaris]|eukprot:GAX24263.1 hypothetical protein FisN_4Lh034 [Fistulifera solaris]